jgi:hypothetical protein
VVEGTEGKKKNEGRDDSSKAGTIVPAFIKGDNLMTERSYALDLAIESGNFKVTDSLIADGLVPSDIEGIYPKAIKTSDYTLLKSLTKISAQFKGKNKMNRKLFTKAMNSIYSGRDTHYSTLWVIIRNLIESEDVNINASSYDVFNLLLESVRNGILEPVVWAYVRGYNNKREHAILIKNADYYKHYYISKHLEGVEFKTLKQVK